MKSGTGADREAREGRREIGGLEVREHAARHKRRRERALSVGQSQHGRGRGEVHHCRGGAGRPDPRLMVADEQIVSEFVAGQKKLDPRLEEVDEQIVAYIVSGEQSQTTDLTC